MKISRRHALKDFAYIASVGIFVPRAAAQVLNSPNRLGLLTRQTEVAVSTKVLQQSQTASDTDLNVGENGPDRTYSLTQFTASSSYTLTEADFQLRKTASAAQTIDARIFSNNAGPNDPNALLATSTNTLAASTIVADTYYAFTFSGFALTNGTIYWIGMKATPIDGAQFPIWRAIAGSGRTEFGDATATSWSQYTGNPHAGTYKLYSG